MNFKEKLSGNRMSILLFIICMLIVFAGSGCQSTPEKEEIIHRSENLEDIIQKTASDDVVENLETIWRYENEYDSGRKLIVDAEVVNNKSNGAPVISIQEKEFESVEEMERIVCAIFPDYSIFETTGKLTKEQLEDNILMCKEALQSETDPESIQYIESLIKEAEREYKDAPTYDSLPPTKYELEKVSDGSEQLNLVGINNSKMVGINFVNNKYIKGSMLFVETITNRDQIEEEPEEMILFAHPSSLSEDAKFQEEKIRMDQLFIDMGVDYMELNSVSKYSNGYEYYYTRIANDFPETYASSFFGDIQSEGEEYMDLWKKEYFKVRTVNGDVNRIIWDNPSKIIEIENDNVQFLQFEEAKEIFMKQMNYMLNPNIESEEGKEYNDFFRSDTRIYINRIELGLTKILMQNTKDSYKLIPTWSFMGCEVEDSMLEPHINDLDTEMGSEICFVTINALDGSVVNHPDMY